MSKRFTDSDKFKDKWYRNLTPIQKCIWEFFVSECNHAGILELDIDYMSFCIGSAITENDLSVFNDKIKYIKDDLIFIPNFICFQQKISDINELNPKNNCHNSIIKELSKYNIDNDFNTPSVAPDEGLVRGYSKGKGNGKGNGNGSPTKEEIEQYCKMQGFNINIDDFYNYYSAVEWLDDYGKPIKWKQKVITWRLNTKEKGGNNGEYNPYL